MSKPLKTIYYFAFACLIILQSFILSNAQTAPSLKVEIKVSGTNTFIEGSFADAPNRRNPAHFSFLKSYAGIENLATRVSNLNLFGINGEKIGYKKLADGEFLADGAIRAWNYQIDLSPPQSPSAMAHVSWLSGDGGILMLADLLPESSEKITGDIRLKLPFDWEVASFSGVKNNIEGDVYRPLDLEKAVFYTGKNWRQRELSAGSARINLIISGEWQVSDEESAQMAVEIFSFYEKLFGRKSFDRYRIFLGKFPPDAGTGRWEAETRGDAVTIFSSEMNFKTQSLQRLHEQMRHELFHFWFPNGVNLSGNYDWFYEGFALYQSLKTAVAMKRIRFDDFLDTLSRAHAIDSASRRRVSLIEASKNRWNGANTQIYARGMLVAFLTDVALLQSSKGKTSLADILREIYQKHNLAAPRTDGNTAILNILESRAELRKIVESYIKTAETIAWQTDLEAIGIESATGNFATKLKVKADPSGRQKDLLDKLGYNNWRK